MVPFKSEVSAMTDPMAQLESLGGHPPVDGLYRSVKERYDRLVSSLNTLCTATQECCQLVQEFEQCEEGIRTNHFVCGGKPEQTPPVLSVLWKFMYCHHHLCTCARKRLYIFWHNDCCS